MPRFVGAGLAALVALLSVVSAQTPAALPPWTPGTLDIHHIATGQGNSTFLVLPDGTTMLVDAVAATPVVLKRLLNRRIYDDPRDIFVLELRDETKAAIGPRAEQVASDHGHVVVRVAPGGASYEVFVLDDRSESYAVLSTHGPYRSGK